MKPAPKPTIPRIATHTTARIKPWSPSRGPRLAVAHLRKLTGADMCLDFTGPDEHDMPGGLEVRDTSVRDRATTPSQDLIDACALLDPYTGNRREEP